MNRALSETLLRQSKLAFRRVRPGATLIRRFHSLPKTIRGDADLQRLSTWLVVPFSLWPIDIIGLVEHLIKLAEKGKRPTPEIRALIALLGNPPKAETCDVICAHEHLVKGGTYESLIKAQHKFDAKEARLVKDAGFLEDWQWIKNHFEISKHQSNNGVIRRRMVSERNFRPDDWDFAWHSTDDRFDNVFDAFCHKWTLYGMEQDKPLLQKLSVNITPYGTMIVIPRYWSFDYKRDLKWRSITRLHHCREVPRQGAKLLANQSARRTQAAAARRYLTEAKRLGMKGEARDYWVMEKAGMPTGSDPRQLRRVLKVR
ncbi:MAG: hypothetical protein ABI651_08810 [Verrucomicrobiota bacterium]